MSHKNNDIIDLRIPQMGEGLYEVKIIKLLKKPGDLVKEEEIIYEMETDKSAVAVESSNSGIIMEWKAQAGDIVNVGSIIGTLKLSKNTDCSFQENFPTEIPITNIEDTTHARNLSNGSLRNIPPRIRAYCKNLGITGEEILELNKKSEKISIADIDEYLARKEGKETINTFVQVKENYTEQELSSQQKILIQRFRRSQQSVIPSTMTSVIEIDKLKLAMQACGFINSEKSEFVSMFIFFAYCVTQICSFKPKFRSCLINDRTVREYDNVNLGIAVNTKTDDLMVTVLESANLLDITGFINNAKQKITAASNNTPSKSFPHIILSYLGNKGIISGTPLLVEPSIATLFLGGTYLSEGKLLSTLSLTFDHRLINGMEAADFLKSINSFLENLISQSEIVKDNAHSSTPHIEEWLLGIISTLLKIEVHQIDKNESLGIQGLDSIMAIELAQILSNHFKTEFSPLIIWEYPNCAGLIKYLTARFGNIDSKIPLGIPVSKALVKLTPFTSSDIAIIGITGTFPQGENLDTFWEMLAQQKDLIIEVPKDRWDWREYDGNPHLEKNKTRVKWGGFINNVSFFDAEYFNISRAEAKLMDPQQRILLENVWNALLHAGYCPSMCKGSDMGVFVGASLSDYSAIIKKSGVSLTGHYGTGWSHSLLANRISFLLGVHGPSESIDTACSSSLVAIHHAVESLKRKECTMAIACGVNIILTPDLHIAFNSAGMLSEDGKCRTFDADANGYVRGEGCGVIVLKLLEEAKKDKDYVYGVIKNVSVNHGGRANSLTAPNPQMQAELIHNAYMKAEVDPRSVSYIEAHGTGTKLGDPIEINGLTLAFNSLHERYKIAPMTQYCGIGSVKTNIGHLEAAAGIAGVIKVILSMQKNILPGLANFTKLNPHIQLDHSPFHLITDTQEWKPITNETTSNLKIAGVSSFGFGGTNAHVVLSEYKMPEQPRTRDKNDIIFLSSRDKDNLFRYVFNFKEYLLHHPDSNIEDIAYTLQVGREQFVYRVAFIASDTASLYDKVSAFLNKQKNDMAFYTNIYDNNVLTSSIEDITPQVAQWYQEQKFDTIAQSWTKAGIINWVTIYKNQNKQRIALPFPPFNKKHYWVN